MAVEGQRRVNFEVDGRDGRRHAAIVHPPDRGCGSAWHLRRAQTHLPCACKVKDGCHSFSNTTLCACGHPPSSTFPCGREAPSASFLCRQRPIRPSRLGDLWQSIEVLRTCAQRKRSWIGSTETPLLSQTVRGREGTRETCDTRPHANHTPVVSSLKGRERRPMPKRMSSQVR